MQNNPIEDIRKVEEEGKNLIDRAKKEVEQEIAQTKVNGQTSLDSASDAVQSDIQEILDETKSKIAGIIAQGKRDLENKLRDLNNIDQKSISQAAEIVVKEIV